MVIALPVCEQTKSSLDEAFEESVEESVAEATAWERIVAEETIARERLPLAASRIAPLAGSDTATSASAQSGTEQTTTARTVSAKRLAANRRNALKSTGPKTDAGKKRSSRNALKHGLCATFSPLDCEEDASFNIFVDELRVELRPATALQNLLFNEIVTLTWRLRRLPETQNKIFTEELAKASDENDPPLAPSDVLARRFSADPHNGFILLDRYERGIRSALHRNLNKLERLQKTHSQIPYADDEPPVPDERKAPAWSQEALDVQIETFERRREELKNHCPPRNQYEADIDLTISRQDAARAEAAAKQTHRDPAKTRDPESETQNPTVEEDTPLTKRSQRADEQPDKLRQREDRSKRTNRTAAACVFAITALCVIIVLTLLTLLCAKDWTRTSGSPATRENPLLLRPTWVLPVCQGGRVGLTSPRPRPYHYPFPRLAGVALARVQARISL